MTRLAILSLGALLLLAGAAGAQDPNVAGAQSAPALTDLSSDDLPIARQMIDDEAQHRDRLARLRRLRELAVEAGDRERLQQLDDLERRQLGLHEARRLRSRSNLSERGRASTDDFLRRGGTMRARVASRQAERERAAAQQSSRERQAAAQSQRKREAQSGSSSRAPSRPRGNTSGGGRSPR
jgi:hypothetical protein